MQAMPIASWTKLRLKLIPRSKDLTQNFTTTASNRYLVTQSRYTSESWRLQIKLARAEA
jgi:hypothetical protein